MAELLDHDPARRLKIASRRSVERLVRDRKRQKYRHDLIPTPPRLRLNVKLVVALRVDENTQALGALG